MMIIMGMIGAIATPGGTISYSGQQEGDNEQLLFHV